MQTVELLDSQKKKKKKKNFVLNKDISSLTPDPVLLLANAHWYTS